MNDAERALVADVHATPAMLVYEFAGAGVGALAALHGVGGSSRTVLEAVDRYAPRSLEEAVGGPVPTSVDEPVAAALARRALERARQLAPPGVPTLGIGCTATIATDRPKRGDHRAYVAAASPFGTHHLRVTFEKGERDRDGEEALVSALVLNAIAAGCGVLRRRSVRLLGDERVEERLEPSGPVAALLGGAVRTLSVDAGGAVAADPPWRHGEGAIVSGSFNPLHDGHLGLAAAAGRHLRRPAWFELSLTNAEKPELDPLELYARAVQFPGRAPLLVTRAPLFVDKAETFPGCVFVIGADTAARVLAPRFYGGDDARDAAFSRIRGHGCRFLVAGRRSGARFVTLSDLGVPPAHADLFDPLPEEAFRSDVSSSAIRDGWGAGA